MQLDTVRRAGRLLQGRIDADPVQVGELRVAVGRPAVLAADVESPRGSLGSFGPDQLGERLREDPVTYIPLLVGLQ